MAALKQNMKKTEIGISSNWKANLAFSILILLPFVSNEPKSENILSLETQLWCSIYRPIYGACLAYLIETLASV
jgi:hypothetical protein